MSSKVGNMGDNHSGSGYLFLSSKAVLNVVIKSQSLDLAEDDIGVIAIPPDWVMTDMDGANALINTETSIGGIKRILDTITPLQIGCFIDYSGYQLLW
ncbi:hypothetical protein [Shewanella sp. GXUN23E]|uniref:hypothetical protein n=1 Tax=Shewanella sp. GXUN23E TaxID=3422498 RepID=UPI003D7E259D